MRYLWAAFLALHRARSSSGFGPNPISWAEIEAYSRLNWLFLDPWEVDTIRSLDEAYMEFVAEQQS